MEPKVLLIVPPFASAEFQSLGLHNLQACARDKGYSVDIDYINMEYQTLIGETYNDFCKMNYFLLGERVFARAAWGDRVKKQFYQGFYNYRTFYNRDSNPVKFYPEDREIPVEKLIEIEEISYKWVDSLKSKFNRINYTHIGITTSFEQTNAAIAILKIIKGLNPNITTFIGGFNTEAEAADGFISLDPNCNFIDYIFSGESEITFLEFLNSYRLGETPKKRVIVGKPLKNLDIIPNLDYSDYFNQLKKHFGESYNGPLQLAMETSRGCWWGEKSQCNFCGTSDRVCYRQKSENRILSEIDGAKKWGVNYLHMADLIMPHTFLNGFLDKIINLKEEWEFYYEEKVSLKFKDMEKLYNAGIRDIQPGLESLSTNILKKMDKGTSLKQNINFLRDATVVGFNLFWNIVWGIPGEKNSDYKEINKLIPLIVHLIPPIGIFHMTLVKFSPYINNPAKYGITNIKPIPSYSEVFPEGTLVDKLAIIYSCDYKSETLNDPTEIEKMMELVGRWKSSWDSEFTKPRLHICKQGDGQIVLLDTRGIEGLEIKQNLTDLQIECLLDSSIYSDSKEQNWAIFNKAGIVENKDFIPLATIDTEIRRMYEN